MTRKTIIKQGINIRRARKKAFHGVSYVLFESKEVIPPPPTELYRE